MRYMLVPVVMSLQRLEALRVFEPLLLEYVKARVAVVLSDISGQRPLRLHLLHGLKYLRRTGEPA